MNTTERDAGGLQWVLELLDRKDGTSFERLFDEQGSTTNVNRAFFSAIRQVLNATAGKCNVLFLSKSWSILSKRRTFSVVLLKQLFSCASKKRVKILLRLVSPCRCYHVKIQNSLDSIQNWVSWLIGTFIRETFWCGTCLFLVPRQLYGICCITSLTKKEVFYFKAT